jgi:hypothetical protein
VSVVRDVPLTSERAQAGIEALAWLGGAWQGMFGEDRIDEHWSAPAAGTMVASFRWIQGGKLYFTEHITVQEELKGLLMCIKHFDPNMQGWEDSLESVRFWATVVKPGELVLMREDENKPPLWLVYALSEPDVLEVHFAEPGQVVGAEEVFWFFRHNADAGCNSSVESGAYGSRFGFPTA